MKKNTENPVPNFVPQIIQNNPYIFLVLLGFAVYFQSLFFGIVDLDDNILVLDISHVTNQISNFYMAFTRDVFLKYTGGYYRPVLVLTFFIDGVIGGSDPFYYHLSNVIIHLIAVLVLYKFLIKFGMNKNISLLFSSFFAIHPALSQAVSWIPGRNDSLLFVFVVMSFYYLIDKKYFLHLLFFTLAVFTKENAIVIVPLIWFYWFFIKKEKSINAEKVKLSGCFIFIFISWFLLRKAAFSISGSDSFYLQEMLPRLLNNMGGFFLYIGKIFFPVNLAVLPVLRDSTIIYGFLSLILIAFLYIKTKSPRKNYILFGILWFLFFIMPAVATRYDFMEHRAYLPVLGFFILLSELDFFRNFSFDKKYKVFVVVIVLFLFIIINIFHSRVFLDAVSFWNHAVQTSPHYALSHKNMGCEFYKMGKMDDAKREFIISLSLNPNEPMIHNNLGLIYVNQNDYDHAEQEYLNEIKINPNYDIVQYNLGLLYFNKGDFLQARTWFEKNIRMNPNNIEAFVRLLECSMRLNDLESVALYRSELAKRGIRLIQ